MESIPNVGSRQSARPAKTALAEHLLHLCTLASRILVARPDERAALCDQAQLCLAELRSGLEPPALTAAERAVLAALETAANRGEACPTADDLLQHVNFGSHSTTVAVIQRLERRGLIRVDRYQRARRVTIVATGRSTTEPKSKARHWRDRK